MHFHGEFTEYTEEDREQDDGDDEVDGQDDNDDDGDKVPFNHHRSLWVAAGAPFCKKHHNDEELHLQTSQNKSPPEGLRYHTVLLFMLDRPKE